MFQYLTQIAMTNIHACQWECVESIMWATSGQRWLLKSTVAIVEECLNGGVGQQSGVTAPSSEAGKLKLSLQSVIHTLLPQPAQMSSASCPLQNNHRYTERPSAAIDFLFMSLVGRRIKVHAFCSPAC